MAFFRWFIIFFLMLSSCQYFETTKISSEEIYEEEMKTINWNDVDSYPLFENCEESLEKLEQRDCFTNTLSTAIYQKISQENWVASRDVLDTIFVDFQVANTGKMTVLNTRMDSLSLSEFPNIQIHILAALDSIQPLTPAYKRGIPVETHFTLPLVLRTD